MLRDAKISALNNEFSVFLTGYYQKGKNLDQPVLFFPKSRNADGVIRTMPLSMIDSSATGGFSLDNNTPISMCL